MQTARCKSPASLLVLVCACALFAASPLRAQVVGDVDLQRFHPASTPWSGLANGSSDILAPGDWILGLHFDYAKNPLLLRRNGTREAAGVKHRAGLEVQAAVGVFDRLELAMALPFVLYQEGNDLGVGTLPMRASGDLRIAPRVAVLRQWQNGIGLVLSPTVLIPVSAKRALASEGVIRFAPEANLSWRGEDWFFGGAARFLYRGELSPVDRVTLGSEIVLGASVGRVLSENLDAIVEFNGGLALSTVSQGALGNPLEGLFGLRYRAGDWITLQAAGGAGILSAPGTPDWRVVFGLYTGHGRPRPTDTCVLHDPAGNQTLRKTGRDSDHDGIDDACDLCPFTKGVAPDGCPEVQKCVAPPIIRIEPKPEPVVEPKVTAKRKTVVVPVEFEFDKDEIRESSLPLITNVVEEFKKLPDVMVCWVRGHTDGRGKADYNLDLSQRRAEAVMREMIKQGLDPKRLYAQGYGLTRHVATNSTDEGRQKNRRVEFVFTLPGDVDPGAKGGSAP